MGGAFLKTSDFSSPLLNILFGVMQEMLSRREFIRLSGGAAAGAALAGLGLSVAPCKAHAIVGVDDALLGAGVLGLAGLLGIALGYKTYTDIQNGVPDAVGGSFSGYLADRANESAIVGAAAADAATVVGAGYSEAQLKEAYARGAWADGLAQSITSTSAGALDWLNARTADAALAWGAFKAWTGILSPDYATSFVKGVQCGAISPLNFMSMVGAASTSPNLIPSYAPPFDVKTSICWFVPSVSEKFRVQCVCFSDVPTFFDSDPGSISSGLAVFPNSNGGLSWRFSNVSCYQWMPSYDMWRSFTSGNGSFALSGVSQPATYRAFNNVAATVINPAMDRAVDTPQSIDPAGWGFGVPVIGTDAVIGNDTLDSTGHLLAPGTLGEMMGDGSLTIPWADMVYGAGLGLSDARVRGIEGDVSLPLGYPIPLDVPVTVSVPLSDTAYGEKTMTLEQALTTGIDTSISRATDIPVTVEGTPFYPVPVPGSDVSIPSGLPFSGLHWETVFPFNMIYSLTDWISKNL